MKTVLKTTLAKTTLAAALAFASTGAVAQNSAGEQVIYQILQNVLGNPYQNDRRYQNSEYQEAFRRADTNRDGRLTQYEIDAYRARYGGGYRDDNRYDYRYDRRGVRVSDIDLNRNGWISDSEQDRFIRMIENQRRRY